jgi:cytochrome P450
LNTSADLWEEPSVFRPERFLDVEGKLNSSISGRVMGFGDGICLNKVMSNQKEKQFF